MLIIFYKTYIHNSYISDNPNLDAKLINFGNSTIKYCIFYNTKISCYEPHTCQLITLENLHVIRDVNAHKEFKICTREDIDTVLSEKESRNSLILEDNKNNLNDNKTDAIQNEKKSNSLFIIILGCIIVTCIGIFVAFMFIKKSKNKKSNESYFNLDDEKQTKIIAEKNRSNIEINNTNTKTSVKNNNNTYKINQNKTIMANLNEMMEEIYQRGSYSSFSSFGFSSFSSK